MKLLLWVRHDVEVSNLSASARIALHTVRCGCNIKLYNCNSPWCFFYLTQLFSSIGRGDGEMTFGGRIIAAMLGTSQDMCWCPRIYWFKWFESFLKKKISKNYFFIMPLKINNVASHAFLFGFHKERHMALPLLPAPRSVLCFWLLELDSSNGCNVQLIAGWRRSTLFLDEFDCWQKREHVETIHAAKKNQILSRSYSLAAMFFIWFCKKRRNPKTLLFSIMCQWEKWKQRMKKKKGQLAS